MTAEADPPPSLDGGLLSLEVDAQGIATLWIGREDARPASLSPALLAELDGHLQRLEDLAAEGTVGAVLLRGRTPGVFVGGFDPVALEGIADARAATAFAKEGQRVLRRLEQLSVPAVALVDGACLGPGLELALACSYRLASDSRHTRLGLPEVRLGLIPGFGATVRLPRLIGLRSALDLILSGRAVDPLEAQKLGLVDAVIPSRHVDARAERFVLSRIPTDRAAGPPRQRPPRRLLEETVPGRQLILRGAARRLRGKALPGAEPALELMAESVALPPERAFRREAKVFGRLLAADPARALLRVQRITQEATRVPPARTPVRSAAVLGAGETGTSFAYLLARQALPVRLKDRKRTATTAARQAVEVHLRHDAERGHIPRADASSRAALVDVAHGFGGFGTLDLVVAAVGDRPGVVARALRDVEEHVAEECVLVVASPLTAVGETQAALAIPNRAVGMHLAEPASVFPLLEIVPGPETDVETLARCRDLARRLGRVPVQAADRPGFLLPRLLAALFAEGLRLLDEGATVLQVDRALERFGFVMGPFRRMDALGTPRALRLMEGIAATTGEWLRPAPIARRIGEGEGFYRYRGGEPAGVNPRLPAGLTSLGAEHDALIRDRVLAFMLNEAARIVEEGTATVEAVDLASVHGVGFPRAGGGLIFHAQRAGGPALEERMRRLLRFGDRFAPAPLVHRLVEAPRDRDPTTEPATGHAPRGVL